MPTGIQNSQIVMLLGLVVGVGVSGILTVWLLMLGWRRHERRVSRKVKEPAHRSDIWQASGDRLSAMLNQVWTTERHGRIEDDDHLDDDPLDDEGGPWEDDLDDDEDDDDDEFAGR